MSLINVTKVTLPDASNGVEAYVSAILLQASIVYDTYQADPDSIQLISQLEILESAVTSLKCWKGDAYIASLEGALKEIALLKEENEGLRKELSSYQERFPKKRIAKEQAEKIAIKLSKGGY